MGYAPSMKSQVFRKWTAAETEAEIARVTGADAILKKPVRGSAALAKRPQPTEIQYQKETSPGVTMSSGALH